MNSSEGHSSQQNILKLYQKIFKKIRHQKNSLPDFKKWDFQNNVEMFTSSARGEARAEQCWCDWRGW